MLDPAQEFAQELAVLRGEFVGQLPGKLARVDALWQGLLTDPRDGDLADLLSLVHSLAGSGGMFGYPALSTAATALQHNLRAEAGARTFLAPARQAGVRHLLAALFESAGAPAPGADAAPLVALAPALCPAPGERILHLITADQALAGELSAQLTPFGYIIHHWTTPEKCAAAGAVAPAARIVDTLLLPACAAVQYPPRTRGLAAPQPLLFISRRDDLDVRLQALRAGGAAFLTVPIDGALVAQLDRLTAPPDGERYRILIVDDEPRLALYLAGTLTRAGMLTAVVTDPLRIAEPLARLQPDLILMDMHMPGCTGLELASVLRQHEAYASLPIVFLSAETAIDQHLAGLQLGGGDFLAKPIAADHLVAAVASRVQRLRTLRSCVVRAC